MIKTYQRPDTPPITRHLQRRDRLPSLERQTPMISLPRMSFSANTGHDHQKDQLRDATAYSPSWRSRRAVGSATYPEEHRRESRRGFPTLVVEPGVGDLACPGPLAGIPEGRHAAMEPHSLWSDLNLSTGQRKHGLHGAVGHCLGASGCPPHLDRAWRRKTGWGGQQRLLPESARPGFASQTHGLGSLALSLKRDNSDIRLSRSVGNRCGAASRIV
jgi:hypothetical protein